MDEKIIERVRKLLELAHGNTSVSEAANAASAAQTLMSRHAISEAMLGKSSTEPEEQIEQDLLHSGKQNTTWRGGLAMAICAANGSGRVRAAARTATANPQMLTIPSQKKKWRGLFQEVRRILLSFSFIIALCIPGYIAPVAARARRGRFGFVGRR